METDTIDFSCTGLDPYDSSLPDGEHQISLN